jgi:formylglycine-generating enzyme required for sulfatase activity
MPIGTHPSGMAASGAQNMIGSVWEMMNTSYGNYPLESQLVVNDFAAADKNVPTRGGSWYSDYTNVRFCGSRLTVLPFNWNITNGIRLVIVTR